MNSKTYNTQLISILNHIFYNDSPARELGNSPLPSAYDYWEKKKKRINKRKNVKKIKKNVHKM